MQTLYQKILDLELWHDYCLGQPDPQKPLPEGYDISGLLAIVPTPNCQRMLKNLRWVFRPQPHGATLFAKVEAVGSDQFQTQIPIAEPDRLTFWLVVRDPHFANFTNLPFTTSQDGLYYFSNLSGNVQGQTLFLTQPLPPYAPQTAYGLGQLVTHEGQTWEALRDRLTTGDDPDPQAWQSLPGQQYVSAQDQLPRQARFPQADPGEVLSLSLINVNQQACSTLQFTVPDTHPAGAAIAIPLNVGPHPPGRYQLLQPDTQVKSAAFVLTDPMVAPQAWGLVELELSPRWVPPAFSLVKQVEDRSLIQPRTYVIRFKNRATHWRYRYDRPHGFTPEKLLTLNLHYDTDKIYFTQRPQGLVQRPNGFFMDGKDRLLPAPRVTQIKPESQIDPETQEKTIAIFSDIYL